MKQGLVILTIVAVSVLLGAWVLLSDRAGPVPSGAETHVGESGHDAREETPLKGPHGGRLFRAGDFALELTIFEAGVPPEFRAYGYADGEPLPPQAMSLTVTLHRLGRPPEVIRFTPERDYLRGSRTVVEPHSFEVALAAGYRGATHRWGYSQVEGRVELPEAAARRAGVEIATAGPQRIQSTVQLPGEIGFDRDRLVHITPRLPGVAASAPAHLGAKVEKGQVLAVIESRELADLAAEYLAARGRTRLARDTHARERQLWREKISAEQDYRAARQRLAEAEIAEANARQALVALGVAPEAVGRGRALARHELRSPIAGTVIEKHLAVGEAVAADTSVFVIADLSRVWAEFAVSPEHFDAVRLGETVRVRSDAPELSAEGPVEHVGALVGDESRTAEAHVELENPGARWRPGLFVTVEAVRAVRDAPVVVRSDAIQTWRDGPAVFARYGEYFEVRPVTPGLSDGTWTEVLDGLLPGESYAAGNSFVLKAELGKAGATHDH